MGNKKLKPCPFCGYSYAEVGHDKEGWSFVHKTIIEVKCYPKESE